MQGFELFMMPSIAGDETRPTQAVINFNLVTRIVFGNDEQGGLTAAVWFTDGTMTEFTENTADQIAGLFPLKGKKKKQKKKISALEAV